MKFTDGAWLIKPGVTANNCEQIREIRLSKDNRSLWLFCVRYRENERSMEGPVQEVTITSPGRDMLRLQTVHHKGQKPKPKFELNNENLPMEVTQEDNVITVRSGEMRLIITKRNPCSFTWYFGEEKLTSIGMFFDTPMLSHMVTSQGEFMRCQLEVDVGEKIYGLGERFTPFVRNGQVVDCWNEDGGTASEIAYKNIPFYLSNRNYGVLVNETGPVSFEICSEAVTKVQFSVPGQRLDFVIMGAKDRKGVLERYTLISGRAALPPAWTFGLWLTSSFTTSYDEKTVLSFVDGMAERKIPLSVFHFDCYWMKENEWCGFEWDPDVFPDVEGLLKKLHDRGLKVCAWINSYIGQKSPTFDEAAEKGYLLKKPNGDIWQWDRWQGGMGVVDFTNPDAVKWYQDKLRGLMAQGVDCFKTDFGERIPTDVVYHNGADPVWMHNYYTYLYNKAVFEVLQEVKGQEEAVVFARSATVGGQKFPVHWGGDCSSSYVSMAESLRGGLSLCLSGFGFWSHDIGGFSGMAPAHIYKRWLAFGLLSSHSRLHGSESYRVPWLFGEESVDVCRHFTELKCRLMPYLYSKAVEAHETGIPMMRAMLLEFDDLTCEDCDRQYMLGESLLVAPVFREDGQVDYYLPKGKWTHLLTGEMVEGAGWHRDKYDFFSLPLFVRENTILSTGSRCDRPDYDYCDNITLTVYNLVDGAEAACRVYGTDGQTALEAAAVREGDTITVTVRGEAPGLTVKQVGTDCCLEILNR